MMDKDITEIREGMADFENRISYLESLHTPSFSSYDDPDSPIVVKSDPPLPTQWDTLQQIKAQLLYIDKKINTLEESMPKKKAEYIIK